MPDFNQSRPADGTNYYVGDNSEIWIHPVTLTSAAPSPTQRALLTAGGTIAAGTTTVTATTAITSKLLDQQRIILPNNQVIMIDASAQATDVATGTKFFPVGATALKIYAPLAALTMPASVPYEEYIPFFSCNEVSFKLEGQIVDFKNFKAGSYKIKRKTSLDSTFTTNGYTTRVDAALQQLRTAATNTDAFIKVRIIPPDGQGLEVVAQPSTLDYTSKDGEAYMAPFAFASGVPTLYNFNVA
jgi:hypothetical protein